jgi:putative phosphoribosyl transferase
MLTPFTHRAHAGEVLARSLERFAGRSDVIVLGVPKGGVPIAYEVATALSLPLDLCFFEPVTSPRGDVTLGLLGWPPVQQIYDPVVNALGLTDAPLRQAIAQTWRRLRQQIHALRPPAPPPSMYGRTAILVDEGIAQGLRLRDAAGVMRRAGARAVVAAAPVGSREGLSLIASEFDEVVCPWQPAVFGAIESFYGDLRPVADDAVRGLLLRAWRDGSFVEAPLLPDFP